MTRHHTIVSDSLPTKTTLQSLLKYLTTSSKAQAHASTENNAFRQLLQGYEASNLDTWVRPIINTVLFANSISSRMRCSTTTLYPSLPCLLSTWSPCLQTRCWTICNCATETSIFMKQLPRMPSATISTFSSVPSRPSSSSSSGIH